MDLPVETKLGLSLILYCLVLAHPILLPLVPVIVFIFWIVVRRQEAISKDEGMYLSEGT